MATELAKQYDPAEAQRFCLKFWDDDGFFHPEPGPAAEKGRAFCIVIPPPNVTGALHLGHALNNTLQDVLVRWRRAQGRTVLWVPGTDHAGIATQAMVEKQLREQEKQTRHDIGREALVERIWRWRDRYGTRILGQLRDLGASCDWGRTRFTLDEVCARAVRQTFFNLFRDGFITRGKRLVNWDAHLQTAVADDEVENVKQTGLFYYFRYPVVDPRAGEPDHVVIGTTRPETMLGDTAVAVHPDPTREFEKRERELRLLLEKAAEKERAEIQLRLDRLKARQDSTLAHLQTLARMAERGARLELPLVGRLIPLIADRHADPEKGTGAVKITPAHDYNDYAVGQRHPELVDPVNILNANGSINECGAGTFRGQAYSYRGLDRFAARERVVADLTALGLFDRTEEVENSIPVSDRSKTPIEPYLSDQWFVKMSDRDDGTPGLAQTAMDAVADGRVRFTPERYAKTYLDWLGEKRDWCISRQLWWGHRIPVWYFDGPGHLVMEAFANDPDVCVRSTGVGDRWLVCSTRDLADDAVSPEYPLRQDPDVLDTWFSSALWPHSTLGWPDPTPDLTYWYPTSVLVTSRDIITLWVARMVMTGLYNVGDVPFRDVYIHPKMLDGFGETMSKTRGNGIDPLDIIDRYGSDALRFGMVSTATETQDSRLPVTNVCPHCDTMVPVKQEHMYMRTKKLTCPNPACKKPFRPGGPWPAPDPELPTAKQASEKFEQGRNFANKLWNSARFVLMNLDGLTPAEVRREDLPIEDRWILSRLAGTAAEITAQLDTFRFSDVARTVYDFTWSEFCDWYVEMSKGRLKDPTGRALAQRVLVALLDGILKLVHPVMPFVAESIWQALNEVAPARGLDRLEPAAKSVAIAPWPGFDPGWQDRPTEQRVGRMQDLIRAVREVRNRYTLDPRTPLEVYVRCSRPVADDLRSLGGFISALAGVGTLECGPDTTRPSQSASHVHSDFEASVSLRGLIDVAAELKRLEKQVAEKTKHLAGIKAKLANEKFVANAPAEVVRQQREMVTDLENQLRLMEVNANDLRAG